mmetsp:Transcript_35992/g.41551  ORF Transcript_35992/g.41551 Transcript_35992/m.41551 type:complete len:126 (-) Transcript_35992:251-628(-)
MYIPARAFSQKIVEDPSETAIRLRLQKERSAQPNDGMTSRERRKLKREASGKSTPKPKEESDKAAVAPHKNKLEPELEEVFEMGKRFEKFYEGTTMMKDIEDFVTRQNQAGKSDEQIFKDMMKTK